LNVEILEFYFAEIKVSVGNLLLQLLSSPESKLNSGGRSDLVEDLWHEK